MSQPAPASAGPDGRFQWGWLFAAVWLVYLGETLGALLDRPGGWQRYVGLVALAVFAVAYLFVVSQGRRIFRDGVAKPLTTRWLYIAGLLALFGLLVPGAGQHALSAMVYIAAATMLTLPLRQALPSVLVFFLGTEAVVRIVPGWADSSYGLAVLLGSLAVFGVRLAIERNQRLAETQQELAQMAVENERTRIAGDLHDILGHSLTVVTIKAELAQRLLDVDIERARAELRDLEMLCRDALTDVRATALGVRGVSLPGEIAAARAALAAAHVEAELPTAADDVPSRWRELFAWTIREAVTNLLRHSRATHCEIRLTPVSVEVLDDGVGMAGSGVGGQGLAGLRRRAEALGARLSVGNRDGAQGTRVLMEVPS